MASKTCLILTFCASSVLVMFCFSWKLEKLFPLCLVFVSSLFSLLSLCLFPVPFLFPRLKWIMRSLITKTWQLSPRLSPSTRYNAPTSFPTSLIPDTRPTRCWRDVAMERYGISPRSPGLLGREGPHGPQPLHHRHFGLQCWPLHSFKLEFIVNI